ncbi:MAG: cytidylate kinase family protein [Fervidicoccaceae archaeon]
MRRRGLIIAVSGSAGSGKTTYAAHLSKELGLKLVSAGKIFRKIAEERGLTLEELNREALESPSVDFLIESEVIREASSGGAVIEGHLAAWAVAGVADLLVFLDAPLEVRVLRIASREGRPLGEVVVETTKRELLEALRYKKFYGIDVTDQGFFHVKLDTSLASEEEIKETLTDLVKRILKLGASTTH